jgi:signal transduction histidine kinase
MALSEMKMEKSVQMGAQNHAIMWHFDEVTLPGIIEWAIDKRNMEEMNKTLKVVNSILRHDILNNLTVIGGSLEIYRMKKDEKFLASATNAVDRSVDIIRKMKEVESVISPKEMKLMNLRSVVDEVVRKFIGQKMRFEVRGEGHVLADDALGSVFENIINNAINHSGSEVMTISIAPTNDGFCEVRIADQGIGIPNEVKPKIWQEGFKYGKSGQSGLGLFIVKKVIERYGGTIAVEDNRPKGTAFVMRLRCS